MIQIFLIYYLVTGTLTCLRELARRRERMPLAEFFGTFGIAWLLLPIEMVLYLIERKSA